MIWFIIIVIAAIIIGIKTGIDDDALWGFMVGGGALLIGILIAITCLDISSRIFNSAECNVIDSVIYKLDAVIYNEPRYIYTYRDKADIVYTDNIDASYVKSIERKEYIFVLIAQNLKISGYI